jgi:hypothetical protein
MNKKIYLPITIYVIEVYFKDDRYTDFHIMDEKYYKNLLNNLYSSIKNKTSFSFIYDRKKHIID